MNADHFAELRVDHLKMIQSVIARLSNAGNLCKNFCISVSIGVVSLSLALQKPSLILLTLIPVVMFAYLNAEYLKAERIYRSHFDNVRNEDWSCRPSFDMSVDISSQKINGFWKAFFSWSIFSFYGSLAVGVLTVYVLGKLCIV